MNIIERQADDFVKYHSGFKANINAAREFLDEVKSRLFDYTKDADKIQFMERIVTHFKKGYDDHLKKCTAKIKEKCPENRAYEDILFYLQNEIEKHENELPADYFNNTERIGSDVLLNDILEKVKLLQQGQEIIYDDLHDKLEEMKDYVLPGQTYMEAIAFRQINRNGCGRLNF